MGHVVDEFGSILGLRLLRKICWEQLVGDSRRGFDVVERPA